MLIFRAFLIKLFLLPLFAGIPALAQLEMDALLPQNENISSALDAASMLALSFDGNMGGVSGSNLVKALESAAESGEPTAMWQLAIMYENGNGVKKDMLKAYNYFSKLVNDYADIPRNSLQADIVAQSFVKLGTYYRDGLPEAGIKPNQKIFHSLLLHAASYFGDADAQYQVGRLFLEDADMGQNPLQSARWLSLAAKKGHVGAQAKLGELLFNGNGVTAQPVEGLVWLQIAKNHAKGTLDERWISEIADKALNSATKEQREAALTAVSSIGEYFSGN